MLNHPRHKNRDHKPNLALITPTLNNQKNAIRGAAEGLRVKCSKRSRGYFQERNPWIGSRTPGLHRRSLPHHRTCGSRIRRLNVVEVSHGFHKIRRKKEAMEAQPGVRECPVQTRTACQPPRSFGATRDPKAAAFDPQ